MADFIKKVKEDINTFSHDALVDFLNNAREKAHAEALKEKHHNENFITGKLKVKVDSAIFPHPKAFAVKVKIGGQHHKTKTSPSSKEPKWDEEFSFNINDVARDKIKIKFYLEETGLHLLAAGKGSHQLTAADVKGPPVKGSVEIRTTVTAAHVGSLNFTVHYTQELPTGDRGFIYDARLPILDPTVPLPALAKPKPSYTGQDNAMKEGMAAIALYWTAFGAKMAEETIPLRLPKRIDWADTDEYFVGRRINGFNPAFIKANPHKSKEEPWDFQVEWDMSYLSPAVDLKPGILFPSYSSARFVVSEDGKGLSTHSIKNIIDGVESVHLNNGGTEYEEAKKMFLCADVNINFTWTHVGVHFNVEQYAMAVYRNLTLSNPLWHLLTPHFVDIVYNDREVIVPKTEANNGVVTMAGTLTVEGQYHMAVKRFEGFSYKNQQPKRVLPASVEGNLYDDAAEVFWNLTSKYVNEYIDDHKDSIASFLPTEIKKMSDDLVAHACNKTPGAMSVETMEDVRELCIYVIYQAIFYHDWVHWNGWDDAYPALIYKQGDPHAPSNAASLEDRSNMIQAFVTYASPTLKQWPILDPQLGADEKFRNLILEHATVLNPGLMVGSMIMAPNT